jgi:hypothetical protein
VALHERDFTPAFCAKLVQQHGTIEAAAQAIASECQGERYGRAVHWRTVRNWISRLVGPRRNPQGVELAVAAHPERLNRIAELLDKANIDINAIGAIENVRVKSWGAAMKLKTTKIDLETGKKVVTEHPHELGLHATDITLRPKIDFPLVQQAAPTKILYRPAPRILRKTRSAIVLSDAQIGFLRDNETDALEPIHDPAALDVAKQIVAAVAPSELDMIGDWMDWPTFSRWPQHPEMRRTLQVSIDAGHQEMAEFISAAGRRCKKRVIIGSNHGYRPEKFILEHNLEAVGVKRAMSQPEEWPIFSEPYLLRFDELGVEFSGQYPGGA